MRWHRRLIALTWTCGAKRLGRPRLMKTLKFTARFRAMLEDAGVQVIRTPRQGPNCNAYAERFVLSLDSECLRRRVSFGESSLRRALREYLDHYHTEGSHQGIGNQVLDRSDQVPEGEVHCRGRLGGLLKHSYRAA